MTNNNKVNCRQGNRVAQALRDATDADLGDFSAELVRTLELGDDCRDLVEEALLETAECVGQGQVTRRGSWTMMNGLWYWPKEARADGAILPHLFSVAHAESPDTVERRMPPCQIDWVEENRKLLVEVAFLSSKAACDAWVACFLLQGAGRGRGATRCLTPDGWVAVTWKEDEKSCLMYLDRTYPMDPAIRSIIDGNGESLIRSDTATRVTDPAG